jgi:transposase
MGRPYSVDMRTRVVAAVDEGDAVDEVAERYKISGRTVWSWLALRVETVGVAPRQAAVGPQPKHPEARTPTALWTIEFHKSYSYL